MSTAKTRDKIRRSIEMALAATPRDIKVHISLRLDSDLYMELHRRADEGEAGGRYQTLLNDLLRTALFDPQESAAIALNNTPTISPSELFKFIKSKVPNKQAASKRRSERPTSKTSKKHR